MNFAEMSDMVKKNQFQMISNPSPSLRYLILYALVADGSADSIEEIFKLTKNGYITSFDERFIRSGLYDFECLTSSLVPFSTRRIKEACRLLNFTLFKNMIEELKSANKDKNIPVQLLKECYLEACKGGSIEILNFIQIDPNFVLDNETPFLVACSNLRLDIVRYLTNKVDLYQIGHEEQNAMHMVCSNRNCTDTLKYLIQENNTHRVVNQCLVINSIKYMVQDGNYTIEELISHVNSIQNVIHFEKSRMTGNGDIVVFDKVYNNVKLGQMLGLCSSCGCNLQVENYESQYKPGVLQNQCDKFGFTPLHRAVIAKYMDAINLLLPISNINKKDFFGMNPIEYAYESNESSIVSMFKKFEKNFTF